MNVLNDTNPFPVEIPPKFLKKAEELNIDVSQITEQFVRGGGAGGQKINKTSNTVVLYYPPRDIHIKCQKHRERERNRISAYKLLILKVEDIIKGKQSERAQKIFKLRKQKKRRSKKAKEKMIDEKKRRGELKQSRKPVDPI